MARLPQPGGDEGSWGEILNSFLSVSHADDGTIKSGAVDSSALQNGSVTGEKIQNNTIDSGKIAAGNAPASGQLLSYDGTGFEWVNNSGSQGPAGEGVPGGGLTNQVLAKASNADYDTQWINQANAVASVFGRTGVVTAQNSDYSASQVTNAPAGNIAATTVQDAINELDTEKAAAAHTHDDRYYTEAETDSLLDDKENAFSKGSLIAGSNVTLDGTLANRLVGSGDITISATGGGGGGGMDDFTLAGDAGTPQTISDGNTLTISGGTGIDTTAGATDTVTVALDSDTQSSIGLAESAVQPDDLADVATSGSYTDLSDTPPVVASVAVSTGSEPRPSATTVFWVGGESQPSNMAVGDVWFREPET